MQRRFQNKASTHSIAPNATQPINHTIGIALILQTMRTNSKWHSILHHMPTNTTMKDTLVSYGEISVKQLRETLYNRKSQQTIRVRRSPFGKVPPLSQMSILHRYMRASYRLVAVNDDLCPNNISMSPNKHWAIPMSSSMMMETSSSLGSNTIRIINLRSVCAVSMPMAMSDSPAYMPIAMYRPINPNPI